jgi:hypothetical protein
VKTEIRFKGKFGIKMESAARTGYRYRWHKISL